MSLANEVLVLSIVDSYSKPAGLLRVILRYYPTYHVNLELHYLKGFQD